MAALAISGLHLRVDDVWSAKETVALALPEEPSGIIEEDHYAFDYKVVEAGPDAYTIEVRRRLVESIVDGHPVPPVKDNKPEVLRESWLRTGEVDIPASDRLIDVQAARLERALHPPLAALATSPEFTSPGAHATWKRSSAQSSSNGEVWQLLYQEATGNPPMTANGTFTLDPATGLPKSIDATLNNAYARGGQVPLRIHLTYTCDRLPAR